MLNFIIEGLTKYKQIGTLLPSSPNVANQIVKLINTQQNITILEVGAGTGAITIPLINKLNNYKKFDICEINTGFIDRLKIKLKKCSRYKENQHKINFINAPIQELDESNTYDVIICSLPFLNFTENEIDDVIQKFRRISKKGTILLYVECVGMRALQEKIYKKYSPDKNDIAEYLTDREHLLETRRVWMNCPPLDIITIPVEKV